MSSNDEVLNKLKNDIVTGIITGDFTAINVPDIIPAGLEKYVELINRQVALIELNNTMVAKVKADPDIVVFGAQEWKIINEALDEPLSSLFNFMLENFTSGEMFSEESLEQTAWIFANSKHNTLDFDEIIKFIEVLVPVAVARFLINKAKISVNTKRDTRAGRAVSDFIVKYKHLILYDLRPQITKIEASSK